MTAPGDNIPLPEHRYVPGKTARHPEGAFDEARALASSPTTSATAAQNGAWRYGLRLFHAGFWWEAHEVWEEVWMKAPPNSAERSLVQGVIQLANAGLKREMGKTGAAERLLAIADTHISDATRGHQSVMDLTSDRLAAMRRAAEEAPQPDLDG